MKTQVLAVVAVVVGVASAAVVATLTVLSPDTAADPSASSPSQVLLATTAPAPLTVVGTITVRGTYPSVTSEDGLTCSTGGGYTDIQVGTQVVITDASATTIALGRLVYSYWDRTKGCLFHFTVTGVPAGQQFYGIEVSHRGRVQFTASQLAAPIELSLGD